MEKTIILYFSGTGNTRHAAETLQKSLANADVDKIIGYDYAKLDAYTTFVFCYPVYALGMPLAVQTWLANLPELKNKKVCLLATLANKYHLGWALSDAEKILSRKNYKVSNAAVLVMPSNFTIFSKTCSAEQAQRLIEMAGKTIAKLAKDIAAGRPSVRVKNSPFFMKPVYRLMYHFFRKQILPKWWKYFKVSDKCTSCNLCANSCPVKSITMENGKPVWHAGCQQCYLCFNICPVRAITQLDSIGRGSKRDRYLFK